MNHELKILPAFFKAVAAGAKNFEIRDNSDRGFQAGDTVTLREWENERAGYTGEQLERKITYVTDYAQKAGVVVFGMEPLAACSGSSGRRGR